MLIVVTIMTMAMVVMMVMTVAMITMVLMMLTRMIPKHRPNIGPSTLTLVLRS